MNRVVTCGRTLIHPKTGKKPTHRISNIHIDSFNSEAVIIIEKGLEVSRLKVSIEELQNIGFLNFDKLDKYCK
jgi:hypothetical protein